MLVDYADLLPEEGQEYLGIIRQRTQKMGSLIDDLLSFSRFSRLPIQRREVDSGALVASVLEDLRAEHPDRALDLRVAELPTCLGDRALLRQVWANLLSNAFKYTKNRSPAIIEIGSQSGPRGQVYFVRDNGAGFDMRYADKLFGVFQRLHSEEEYAGTGVGLAIVQRIVQRHGGSIWAEAAVNQGATFYFTLGNVS